MELRKKEKKFRVGKHAGLSRRFSGREGKKSGLGLANQFWVKESLADSQEELEGLGLLSEGGSDQEGPRESSQF